MQRVQRLVERYLVVPVMDHVHRHPVERQPLQALADDLLDGARTIARSHLGHDDHLILDAAVGHPRAEDSLGRDERSRSATAVTFRRIEARHPVLVCMVQNRARGLLVDLSPERSRTEADPVDAQRCAAPGPGRSFPPLECITGPEPSG